MNRIATVCVLFLAGALPGFATSANTHGLSSANQFHFEPAGRRAKSAEAMASKRQGTHGPARQAASGLNSSKSHTSMRNTKVSRNTANPPTGKSGFLAATDIPMGGGIGWWGSQAVSGDFNGDGKTDFTAIVENYVNNNWVYSISVVLGNGDGTFAPAVLTPIPSNDYCAQIVVGDVNGDSKSDIVVVHQPNSCNNSSSAANVDVLISNGDGTLTESNTNGNFVITTNSLAGGTLADVNKDGKLDIVAVDQSTPANVWTLTGNGDGTFNAPTSVALSGQAGNYAAFADLNGDGLLDIVDLDYSNNELTVYLATSGTTYAPGAAYTTADGSFNGCSLTVGDLTSDGKPEVATANCWYNTVTVYVNNGDGSFQTGTYYNTVVNTGSGFGGDTYPEAVTIGDVNGDGKADIVSSNDDGGDVTILLGNGDGTVNVPSVGYAVGGYPWRPAFVGDINGDGFADIVVADSEFSLVYLKGYGDGTFRAAKNYYSAISTNYAYSVNIVSGDFNGDGYPDFAVGNCCDSNMGISVFLSNPDGTLQPPVNYGTGGNLYQVVVADINADGKLDLVAADNANGLVQIFTGNGDGTFTAGSSYATDASSTSPGGMAVGDFNKDGQVDIAVLNTNGQNVAILINNGQGGFNTAVTYPLSAKLDTWRGAEIAVGDLAGNGNLDLVIPLYHGGTIAVLMGNGDGTFQPEADLAIPSNSPTGVVLADLNKDGKLDLAVTMSQWSGSGIAVALGNGDGTFQTATLLASSLQDYNFDTPNPTYLSTADIDGDGNADIVYTNSEYGTVGVLFGLGDGSFYDPVEYPSGGYAWGIAVADVNQDGSPDVVTAADDFGGVTVLLNSNGSGTFGNYTMSANALTASITAGQSATFTLTITPSNHYNGTITFSCPSGLPALATCTFNPASVTLDGKTPVTVQMTISTTAPAASLQKRAGKGSQGTEHGKTNSALLVSMSGMGVFGMMLTGSLNKKIKHSSLLGMLVLCMSLFLVGCGGSSSSSAKSSTSSSVSSSTGTVLVGQTVTFTGTVSAAAGMPTGTVTFLDGSTTLGTGTLSNGMATYQTSSLAAGVHSITVAYGGDSKFEASTSSALSQTVDNPGTATGSYTVHVTATGTAGTNGVKVPTQTMNVNVTVQ